MPAKKDGTSKYTSKQERKADHIAEGYEKRGVSEEEAEKRAWATVNKSNEVRSRSVSASQLRCTGSSSTPYHSR